MHILFIPKWYPDHRDPQLGDFLRKQAIAVGSKAKVSVLHVSLDPDLEDRETQRTQEKDGVWELSCHYRGSRSPNSKVRRVLNFPRFWRATMNGIQRVMNERGKPDISHAHILVRPAMIAWTLKNRHGIPYVISEQSSEYLDGTYVGKGSLFKAWNRFLFSKASAVTAVSSWLGDRLVEHGLTKSYAVVPNVIPGLDRPLPQAGDPGHFLVVADLVDKTKNVSGVIRAMGSACETLPSLLLTVIGDGPDRPELEKLAREQGLNGNVKFLGRLSNQEVLDHMANVGSVVINSNFETFSVVTGEALAQGKPVIATRCGGPVAFVTPENGLLIEPRDEVGLKTAMLTIAGSKHLYSPEKIRASVSDRFSYEAVGNAFMSIYERVLANGS